MNYCFLDSSAVIKLYVSETGSEWLHAIADSPNGKTQVVLAEITVVEVAAALARRVRMSTNAISAHERDLYLNAFLHDCDTRYALGAVDRLGINQAVMLTQTHKLRGYDAVQLAIALTARSLLAEAGFTPFTFIAADDDLLAAARAEGLPVENPNQHP